MNGSDQGDVRCDFGLPHQFECVNEKRAENHAGGRFELVEADGSLCTWKYPRHQRVVCVTLARTTQKYPMGRSALEYSPHRKTYKVDQIHVRAPWHTRQSMQLDRASVVYFLLFLSLQAHLG